MFHPQIRWRRVLGLYFVLSAICLVTAIFITPPAQSILLVIGIGFIVCFVPLVMAVYFLRGLLRIQ